MLKGKTVPSDSVEMVLLTNDEAMEEFRLWVRSCGTQKAAAEALGVTPQYISDILAGRRTLSEPMAAKLGLEPSGLPWRRE
jgi:hypothetical protein